MGGVYNISISQDQFQNNFILDNDTTYHLASPLLLSLIHRKKVLSYVRKSYDTTIAESSGNQIIGRLYRYPYCLSYYHFTL